MKKNLSLLSLPFLMSLSVLFSGCAAKESASVTEDAVQQVSPESAPAADNATADKSKPKQDRVIRQAEVKFQVQDLAASTQRVEAAVDEMDATLANTTQHQSDDAKTTKFVIRVKPENFKPLLRQLQKESVILDERTITTEDVGMEYVDLEARKKAKLAVEQRFMGLLKEAKNIKQILEVEREIQVVREEIESAEARLRFLQNQTSYSTIRLAMYQVIPAPVVEEPSFVTRLVEAMSTGWELWLSLIVGLCYIWPVWLVVLGIFIFLRKRNLA
ncbi:DUF4349 domain-containing protein [Rufibacter hautae]|uniref:DUF4349 domain-containing protein n=1 Tax=Rufibacter hautae TaxID=2595005 RepID=A0A5B6THH4_9BACT|nr:DUF4349 domain-containing protein [Rufibacter hautae]KAA3438640.1 DUF4349 domain-containing protein [Rufibacter hautae]